MSYIPIHLRKMLLNHPFLRHEMNEMWFLFSAILCETWIWNLIRPTDCTFWRNVKMFILLLCRLHNFCVWALSSAGQDHRCCGGWNRCWRNRWIRRVGESAGRGGGITVTSCKRNELNLRTAVIRKAVSTAVVIRLRAYLCITSLILPYSVLFLCVISMASWKS